MLKKIIDFFKKVVLNIFSPFSKLRIFYQILVVIFIMLGCIFIEGYSNLGVIDSLQQTSTQVFNESIQMSDALFNLNTELLELKISYLKALDNKTRDFINIFNSQDRDYYISYIKKINSNSAEDIENSLNKVEMILKEPINKENFNELNNNLVYVFLTIKNLDSQMKNSTTQRMLVGRKFSQDSKEKTIIMLLISFLISITLGLIIATSISRPLKVMVNATNLLATGDLSLNVNAKGCHEATAMVGGFNRALSGLRDLIKGINQESEFLIIASKDLKDASIDSGRSASEVARAMEELASGSNEQSDQINRTVSTVTELSELVRRVSTDTANIATSSEKMADSAIVGQKVTGDVANEINQLFQSTKEVAVVIEALNRTSGEISEITTVIGGIAEQTTLLALNASIEAARAGDQGKGFSVVAKETGKLAEQSKQSAQMIADLITEMRLKTKHAVEVIQKGMVRVEAGKSLAGEATVTFENIFKDLRDVLAQIDTVATSAQYMSEKNEQVIAAITTISLISEESMASTEEVSATAQQQSAAAEEVSSLAENLEEIANKLKESIAAFDVEAEESKII